MCQAMWGADGRHSHYCDSLHWKTKLEEGRERLYRDLRHNRHHGLHLPSRFAAVAQAFPPRSLTPCTLGQPMRLGLPNLRAFLSGDLIPHPKKPKTLSCYSLKASDKIPRATASDLHSHPRPLALLPLGSRIRPHGHCSHRRLLQPGPSALVLLTAKVMATSSLGEEKQVERNSQTLLQIHQPEAELGNSMHPQPASAFHSTSTTQQHEKHQYSGEVPPERDAFQKKKQPTPQKKTPQTLAFYVEDLHSYVQEIYPCTKWLWLSFTDQNSSTHARFSLFFH